jgi:hypothetical protein
VSCILALASVPGEGGAVVTTAEITALASLASIFPNVLGLCNVLEHSSQQTNNG